MLVLAFDTATPAVTVALLERGTDGDRRLLAESTTVDPRRHGELLAPAVLDVLGRGGATLADVTDLAVGVGPGPYTGLRVGVVTARAFGSALGLPVHGVCTLDALAHRARTDGATGELTAVTDARRKEVYWARYDASGVRVAGPAVDRPADVPDPLPAVGPGARLYADVFGSVTGPEYPSAAALADLVAGAPGERWLDPEPLYLRRPDARVPGAPKPVSPAPVSPAPAQVAPA